MFFQSVTQAMRQFRRKNPITPNKSNLALNFFLINNLSYGKKWKNVGVILQTSSTQSPDQNKQFRVVTRYRGSGINSKKLGGIRTHSARIWDHKPWKQDQQYCKGIRELVFQGIKICNNFEIRDQNLSPKMGSVGKNIPQYDPEVFSQTWSQHHTQ